MVFTFLQTFFHKLPVLDMTCPYCDSRLGEFSQTGFKQFSISKNTTLQASRQPVQPEPTFQILNRYADDMLSMYSKKSSAVYDFMDKNLIGHSSYGAFMDAAGRNKGVMAHRLFGHHVVYDFPYSQPQNIGPFLEHLGSDFFTKQGLPILPGEIIKDKGLLNYCKGITRNWNFVNGFDVLSATVSIFDGMKDFKKYCIGGVTINSFREFIGVIGKGAFEVLVATSTCNPFLLIGGILTITSGVRGMIRPGTRAYVTNAGNHVTVTIPYL